MRRLDELSWDLSNTMEVDFCRSMLDAGDGLAQTYVRDLQFRSGFAVHFQQVPSAAERPCHLDQHGWSWSGQRYFDHYNFRRPHQALDYCTPTDVYLNRRPPKTRR